MTEELTPTLSSLPRAGGAGEGFRFSFNLDSSPTEEASASILGVASEVPGEMVPIEQNDIPGVGDQRELVPMEGITQSGDVVAQIAWLTKELGSIAMGTRSKQDLEALTLALTAIAEEGNEFSGPEKDEGPRVLRFLGGLGKMVLSVGAVGFAFTIDALKGPGRRKEQENEGEEEPEGFWQLVRDFYLGDAEAKGEAYRKLAGMFEPSMLTSWLKVFDFKVLTRIESTRS